MNRSLLICFAICIGTAALIATQAFAARPTIELMMLTEPSVMAVGLDLPRTRLLSFGGKIENTNVRRWDIRISADVLYPFDYHPQGYASGALGIGRNWGLGMMAPSDVFAGTYVGALFAETGIESRIDSARKYRAQNYTFSAGVEQDVPLTDFVRLFSPTAAPAKLRVAATQVRSVTPLDTATLRGNADLDWTIPLPLDVQWITAGRGFWQKDVRPYAYIVSGGAYPIPMGKMGSGIIQFQPMFFARYVHGRRPPDYRMVNIWEYGFTTSFGFGGKRIK